MQNKQHFKKLKKGSVFSLALVMLLVVTSCSQNNSFKQDLSATLRVEGYVLKPEYFSVNIRSTGELLPFEEVELRTPVAGNVFEIFFEEGQIVNKGDLLVEIDNRTWTARKKGLEARLISAKSELDRQKQLLEIDGVSQQDVEQSEAEVNNITAQIEELDVMIDLAHLRAPFDGRLGMRNFSPGAYLSQGAVVTHLVQNDQLKIDFSVPAKYAGFINIGQDVKVISSTTGDTAVAQLYAVEPMINTVSRSLHARALINKQTAGFLPGDFTQVILRVEEHEDALLVPAEAVIPELNAQVVYVYSDGKAERRKITAGTRTRDRLQVLSGLSEGDIVITTGLMEISDGDQVTLKEMNAEDVK
jgi:membrane fusion protein, multidrug efflux system